MSFIPSIKELQDSDNYELIAEVAQDRIKDFVLQMVMKDKKIIPWYMIYQTLLFLAGLFFASRSLVLAFRGNSSYLIITIASIVFSFTILVAIHELLHGLALKIMGAPRIHFGGNLKRFIFFAEADNYVMGSKPFLVVAFTPLLVVQVFTIIGIVVFFSQPLVYFFLIVMVIHSFFCAGDIALVSLFFMSPGHEIFTFDDRTEKKSYFYAGKKQT